MLPSAIVAGGTGSCCGSRCLDSEAQPRLSWRKNIKNYYREKVQQPGLGGAPSQEEVDGYLKILMLSGARCLADFRGWKMKDFTDRGIPLGLARLILELTQKEFVVVMMSRAGDEIEYQELVKELDRKSADAKESYSAWKIDGDNMYINDLSVEFKDGSKNIADVIQKAKSKQKEVGKAAWKEDEDFKVKYIHISRALQIAVNTRSFDLNVVIDEDPPATVVKENLKAVDATSSFFLQKLVDDLPEDEKKGDPKGTPKKVNVPTLSGKGSKARKELKSGKSKKEGHRDLDDLDSVTHLGDRVAPPANDFKLHYWRNDVQLSEHHENYHRKYSRLAWLTQYKTGNMARLYPRPFRRHGELFFYMHHQLVVRYDTECMSWGVLPSVPVDPTQDMEDFNYPELLPFTNAKNPRWGPRVDANFPDDFSYEVPSTDAPGVWRREAETLPMHRGDAQAPTISDSIAVFENMATTRQVTLGRSPTHGQPMGFVDIIRAQWPDVNPAVPNFTLVDENCFGNIVEPNNYPIDPADDSRSIFQVQECSPTTGLHPLLHVRGGNPLGPLNQNVRDPYFWRWHKNIDNLYFTFTDGLPRVDPREDGVPVDITGDDICLTFHTGMVINDMEHVPPQFNLGQPSAAPAEFTQWSNRNHNWTNASPATPLGRTAHTPLVTCITNQAALLQPFEIGKLLYHPFSYHFRVRKVNHNDTSDIKMTFRVWLCPDGHEDHRRAWIEMDKFTGRIKSGQDHKVFSRSSLASTVTRKDSHLLQNGAPAFYKPNCQCGLPWNLLLPRGSHVGAHKYKLLVCITDFTRDRVADTVRVGDWDDEDADDAIAWCGGEVQHRPYPDAKRMNYPFHRGWTTGTITETLTTLKAGGQCHQLAWRDVYIRNFISPDFSYDGITDFQNNSETYAETLGDLPAVPPVEGAPLPVDAPLDPTRPPQTKHCTIL